MIFSVLVFGLLVAADEKPSPVKEEQARLNGARGMFDMETNGNGVGRAEVKKILFDGDKYTFYHDDTKSPEVTFKLNPAAEPRTIDVLNGGKTMLGIYRFQDGKLEICLAQDGKPRPKIFSTHPEAGAGSVLYVLKPKTPPAKLDSAEVAFQDEIKKLAGNWSGSSREVDGRLDKDPSNHGLLVEGNKWATRFKGKEKETMNILRVDLKGGQHGEDGERFGVDL